MLVFEARAAQIGEPMKPVENLLARSSLSPVQCSMAIVL